MQYADNFFLFEIKWMTELSRFNECSYRLQAESTFYFWLCLLNMFIVLWNKYVLFQIGNIQKIRPDFDQNKRWKWN